MQMCAHKMLYGWNVFAYKQLIRCHRVCGYVRVFVGKSVKKLSPFNFLGGCFAEVKLLIESFAISHCAECVSLFAQPRVSCNQNMDRIQTG